MLTESTIIDRLEVLETGTVQVREATIVKRGDKVIAESFHRFVIDIANENPDLSRLDEASVAVVLAARTPERLAAAQAAKETNVE
jgi:hypothetical protein